MEERFAEEQHEDAHFGIITLSSVQTETLQLSECCDDCDCEDCAECSDCIGCVG